MRSTHSLAETPLASAAVSTFWLFSSSPMQKNVSSPRRR